MAKFEDNMGGITRMCALCMGLTIYIYEELEFNYGSANEERAIKDIWLSDGSNGEVKRC